MFSSLFTKKRELPEPDIELRHVYMALFNIMENHSLVYIRPEGAATTFQSVILDIDPSTKRMVIDELFPRSNFRPVPGQFMTLSVRHKGLTLSFSSQMMATGEKKGTAFYEIELPSKITRDQRRGAFRVDIANRHLNGVSIHTPFNEPLSANLIDISASGVRLEIECHQAESLAVGVVLPKCEFTLGNQISFFTHICLKNIRQVNEPVDKTLLGGQFVDPISIDARTLERFLLRYQRDMRKQELAAVSE